MIPLEANTALEPIHIPAWTWLVVAFLVLAVYAVTIENGALLSNNAQRLHEFFHDARHFLGVPCH